MLISSKDHDNPLLYPWNPPERSGLLLDSHMVPFGEMASPLGNSVLSGQDAILDDLLAAHGLPTIADRHLVVAVGANAAPEVMTRKLTSGTALSMPVIPFVRAVVNNLGVGHAGYASVRGYIPATPYHFPGVETVLWASYLDDDQMEVLDATEPNYHRVKVSSTDYPMLLDNGERPEEFWVYDSYRGVLADTEGVPLPLTTQEELHVLLSRNESLAGRFGTNTAKNMLEFPASVGRPAIADVFRALGVAVDTGIVFSVKRRVGNPGPSDAELEELEELLDKEGQIVDLMGDFDGSMGPVLPWDGSSEDLL